MNQMHAIRRPLTLVGTVLLSLFVLVAVGCGRDADQAEEASPADSEMAAADSPEAQAFTAEVAGHLDGAQEQLDAILAVEGPRTVENTLVPMNEMSIHIDAAAAKSSLLENVHPDPAVRAAAEKGSQDVSAFVTKLSLNRDVYDAVLAVDVSGADPLTQRYVEKTLRDYRRAGVDKDEATRDRIQALKDELVLIGQEFDRNIRDDNSFIEVESVEDLAGLPQDYIDNHEPGENGKIKITTQYPDYIPFMTYAENGDARKELYLAFLNRAYPQNKTVLKNLMTKRQELAQTLGYPNWAAYVTEDKMAQSPERVQEFIEQLDTAAKERGRKDYALLLARKQKDFPGATTVEDYEKSYYGELVKSEQFSFDSQELREYYDFPQVQEGILDVTSTLFGVEYRPVNDVEVWDPSVDVFDVYDGGNRIGRFYLDLHPREGKFSHAAQFTLNTGVKDRQIPVGVLVCNFPGGDGDGPALMEQDDVETFFHEFGHLLHHIFGGNQPWIDMSGVATEWDFVEAPSQMLEEWATDTETLQRFARHYETGEPIPADLVERLRAAKQFGNGTYVTQQNFYTALSLNCYDQDPGSVDLDNTTRELQEQYGMFAPVPGAHMYASFGHLEGYSAMYYTYMWSLVIAKDLFSQFDRANMLDPEVATRYRKVVLGQGGTKDADVLIEEFLGRPYGFDSFRVWLNQDS